MTEMLGPYDPASPCLTTFCKRISKEDYEKQGSDVTQKAIADLIKYLEYNPTAYHNILRKRKREDTENAGVFSWLKVKMLSSMFGDEYCEKMDANELRQKISSLKNEMISSYDYAEEAKGSGRRFSKRIAKRNEVGEVNEQVTQHQSLASSGIKTNDGIIKNLETDLQSVTSPLVSISSSSKRKENERCSLKVDGSSPTLIPKPPKSSSNIPPPSPPPPPIIPVSIVEASSTKKKKTQANNSKAPQPRYSISDKPVMRSRLGRHSDTNVNSEENVDDLMASLKDPQIRASLKSVRGKGISPYQMRHRMSQKVTDKENEFPLFNQQLITKFQNARSPQTPDNSHYLSDVSSPDSFTVSP